MEPHRRLRLSPSRLLPLRALKTRTPAVADTDTPNSPNTPNTTTIPGRLAQRHVLGPVLDSRDNNNSNKNNQAPAPSSSRPSSVVTGWKKVFASWRQNMPRRRRHLHRATETAATGPHPGRGHRKHPVPPRRMRSEPAGAPTTTTTTTATATTKSASTSSPAPAPVVLPQALSPQSSLLSYADVARIGDGRRPPPPCPLPSRTTRLQRSAARSSGIAHGSETNDDDDEKMAAAGNTGTTSGRGSTANDAVGKAVDTVMEGGANAAVTSMTNNIDNHCNNRDDGTSRSNDHQSDNAGSVSDSPFPDLVGTSPAAYARRRAYLRALRATHRRGHLFRGRIPFLSPPSPAEGGFARGAARQNVDPGEGLLAHSASDQPAHAAMTEVGRRLPFSDSHSPHSPHHPLLLPFQAHNPLKGSPRGRGGGGGGGGGGSPLRASHRGRIFRPATVQPLDTGRYGRRPPRPPRRNPLRLSNARALQDSPVDNAGDNFASGYPVYGPSDSPQREHNNSATTSPGDLFPGADDDARSSPLEGRRSDGVTRRPRSLFHARIRPPRGHSDGNESGGNENGNTYDPDLIPAVYRLPEDTLGVQQASRHAPVELPRAPEAERQRISLRRQHSDGEASASQVVSVASGAPGLQRSLRRQNSDGFLAHARVPGPVASVRAGSAPSVPSTTSMLPTISVPTATAALTLTTTAATTGTSAEIRFEETNAWLQDLLNYIDDVENWGQ
ncbi:hypothetical protein SPI_08104 [Niveomyces insectorum RCEF 264]|uniref:Uncharacterized protein n=1 Tax=Niveomyces insectorum RCEF 264 TaxID=1081102 RepID=A0A167NTF6_9HYPO|nr:hypothetical protein SPI_08104 [Niveomyces insectorum RCEF 264]